MRKTGDEQDRAGDPYSYRATITTLNDPNLLPVKHVAKLLGRVDQIEPDSSLTGFTRPLLLGHGISGTWRRAGDVLVPLIRRRRAEDEPVEGPSGRSRHVRARHRDADAWRAVATWAGRDTCE